MLTKRTLIYLLSFTAIVSCSTPRIAVSNDLQASNDEYSVKGRQGIMVNQKLSFGRYHTTKVKRSWTKGSSSINSFSWGTPGQQRWINMIGIEYINRKQTVNFSLSDGRNTSEVFCVSKFHLEDLQLGKNENSLLNIGLDLSGQGYSSSSTYYVQVFINNDEKPWQLVFDNDAAQRDVKSYVGYFKRPTGERYTLHPINRLELNGNTGKTLFGSVGIEIRNANGKSVAAVSLIDRGTVILGNIDEEERFLLANLCSALLLQEHIG